MASSVGCSSDAIRASRWLLLACRWLSSGSRGVRLGGFADVELPRSDLAVARGCACVVRHSWHLLPQSIARGTYKLMGVLLSAGEVCARRRVAGEAVALLVRPGAS